MIQQFDRYNISIFCIILAAFKNGVDAANDEVCTNVTNCKKIGEIDNRVELLESQILQFLSEQKSDCEHVGQIAGKLSII
jgi:hypothetical protein